MKLLSGTLLNLLMLSGLVSAQNTFAITGTALPSSLLQQNYGKLPKGITGYDLNICNVSDKKQSIVSSEIFQALAQSGQGVQPIGRQIMLTAILHNQNRSAGTVASMVLNSMTGILAILSSSKYSIPTGALTGVALGAMSAEQLLTNFKPVLAADQLEKFDAQVLQPALVLDSGSCVERTVFASATVPSAKAHSLSFHVR
ncbi:MAG: hypothetical protein M3Y24_05380 [Acidobacteriota bacterium]|nr:hypothetical protein [Acidobacteriota bacterium]